MTLPPEAVEIDPLKPRRLNSVQSRIEPPWVDAGVDAPAFDAEMYTSLWINVSSEIDRFPDWSIYPGRRDRMIRRFWKKEPIVAGGTYSMVTRIQSMPLNITHTDSEEMSERFREEIIDQADLGNGFESLIGKSLIDYFTQDNGFFWELEGPGNPNGPRTGNILHGIHHLDAGQCFRTFDPEYPVLYVNPITAERHRLHRTRVLSRSNMTQPNETARGIGLSPIARALQQVQLARSILQYRYEKVSGNYRRGVIFGKGTTRQTLRRAMTRVDTEEELEDVLTYNGIPILVSMEGIELDMLDLSSLPDNFDLEKELNFYVYILSLCFGVDAREFWPATVSGATKADASVQHLKAKGKGLADALTTIEKAINSIAWEGLTVEYDHVDDEQDLQRVDIDKRTVEVYASAQNAGFIDAREGRAHLIEEGVIKTDVVDSMDSMDGMEHFDEMEQARLEQEQVEHDRNIETISLRKPPQQQGARSTETYRTSLRSIVRGVWSRQLGYLQAMEAFSSSVTRHLTQAAYAGLKRNGIRPDEMTPEERRALTKRIYTELQFVGNFIDDVLRNPEGISRLESHFARVDIWASRYNEVVKMFEIMSAKNKKFIWTVNPMKEHCVDCLRLANRVYRSSIWDKYGIIPGSARLACGLGGKCGCQLSPTDKPLSRGRPPKLSGPGKSHIRIPAHIVQQLLSKGFAGGDRA